MTIMTYRKSSWFELFERHILTELPRLSHSAVLPPSDSDIFCESCVIPSDVFYSLFDSLADPCCSHQSVLSDLRTCVKAEKFMISRDRFELLLSFTASNHPHSLRRSAFDLIWEFSRYPPSDFFSMVPPTFI
jgi:hypothetical protein